MNEAIRQLVRQRAGHRCEYCQLRQKDSILAALHIEHIIPRKHRGSDEESNLALACIDCNLHKGSNLSGIDSSTGEVVELFHPRKQSWGEHFAWNGIHIIGITATGRATVAVLNMNSDDQLALRSS